MRSLAESGAALLGGALHKSETLHGGDLSQVMRITLADGREAIVKGGASVKAEARMLDAIRATGAPAPAVLAVSDEALVMTVVSSGGNNLGGAWASLGAALARLHAKSGTSYGWFEDYAFGPVAIENAWADDWPRFWAERRLLANLACIPSGLARRIETLAADLANRLPPRPRPALLHGDLWSGNVLVSDHRVTGLIDPACYYGHVEVDFAMLTLFDSPAAAFYDAYGTLEPGHNERVAIYQLWPALVHLRLFGEGYKPLVERLLSAAGV